MPSRSRCSPGARSVVSAALCYWRPEAPLAPGRGPAAALHVGRRLRAAAREARRARPASSAAPYRVLVDANQHVDREAAARTGVGFYGKNTMLITRRHGSWVVLGTLVTDRRARADAAARRRLRLVHALHRRLPDRRARRAGHARRDAVPLVLDAGAGADPGGLPRRARRAGLRLRHLPGRLPVEPRRREAPRRARARRRRPRRPRRLARSRRTRARRVVRPALRAAERPALAAAERARRARERRATTRTRAGARARTRPATTRCSPSTRAGRSSGSLAAREGSRRCDARAVLRPSPSHS